MRRFFRSFIKTELILFFVLAVVGLAYFFVGGYAGEVAAMQKEAAMFVESSSEEIFRMNQTGIVYAADGSVISAIKGKGESYYVDMEHMPANVVAAIISIEDKKFFRHAER